MSSHFKHKVSTIVVPRATKLNVEGASETVFEVLDIAKGSAIAAVPVGDDRFAIYYEGNLNGAVNLHDFRERIYCAAGRAMTKYPTVAVVYLSKADYESIFFEVGQVNLGSDDKMQIIFTNAVAANAWADQYKRTS